VTPIIGHEAEYASTAKTVGCAALLHGKKRLKHPICFRCTAYLVHKGVNTYTKTTGFEGKIKIVFLFGKIKFRIFPVFSCKSHSFSFPG
jgi:hypothetical protein